MRKRFICKRICALASAFIIGIGLICVPNVFAEQMSVFVDEFDGGNNSGTTKAFYSENIREILSSVSSQFGDFTRATRIDAATDGVLVYKSENVGAIMIRGVYPQNGDFEFYYSTDNKEYMPIEPVYGNSVMKDPQSGWYGRDYFFAGFPRGVLYFKIVIPKEDGKDLYNKQINFVKIESGSTTLIDHYDDTFKNSFDLKLDDNKVFKTFEGQLDYSMLGSVSGSDYKNSDMVEISGVVFYAENIKFHELVGRRVYAYVKEKNGKKNVVSFGADEDMDLFTIYKDSIDESESDLTSLHYTENLNDNEITVDEEDYKISDELKALITSGMVKKPKLGDKGKFYFNMSLFCSRKI